MIKVNNYTKEFEPGKGIFSINLTLNPGNVYGLIGPNGAGKTTLITALEGLYKSKGEIDIYGNNKHKNFLVDVSSMLEMTELISIKTHKIGSIYDAFCEDFDLEKYNQLVERFGLKGIKGSITKLSKGESLSLRVAIALARNAKVYLFDEPLSGIDIIKRELILEAIFEVADEDKIVLISSHELHDIDRRIDELIFLNEGKVVLQSSLDQLKDAKEMSLVELYRDILKN